MALSPRDLRLTGIDRDTGQPISYPISGPVADYIVDVCEFGLDGARTVHDFRDALAEDPLVGADESHGITLVPDPPTLTTGAELLRQRQREAQDRVKGLKPPLDGNDFPAVA